MILLNFLGMDLSAWFTGAGAIGIIGIIVTILRKRGYITNVKFWTKKLAVITQELGEAFLETADVFEAMDNAVKENGNLQENKVKEILEQGKEAKMEWKDVIVIFKPKKKE